MTYVNAVNEMLEWIGQPPVTAITVSGNDETNEAQTILDRASYEVQAQGWYCNTTLDATLALALARFVFTVGTGTFVIGETVTESSTGATGTYAYEETVGATSYIYLVPVSGTFTGNHALTGATSAATKTATTYALQTTGKIALPASYLVVVPSETASEQAKIVQRGSFLWDAVNKTYTFSLPVHVELVEGLAFTSLPLQLASLVVKTAGAKFHAYKLRGVTLPPERQLELRQATTHALQEDQDLRAVDTTNTAEARAIKGNRNAWTYRALQTAA